MSKAYDMQLQLTIKCPECGFEKEEVMPTDTCQFFYKCSNCQKTIRPEHGDCCVFCEAVLRFR